MLERMHRNNIRVSKFRHTSKYINQRFDFFTGSVDLDTINDLEQRYALEVQIGEFGQVPKQLFTSPHPQRLAPTPRNPRYFCY